MKMDYYGYEYSVLHILQDELKIESIEKGSEVWDAFNPLGQKVKSIVMENTITLNFTKDFHFCFDTKILFDAFENEISPEKIARHLKRDITDSFVKEFLLK